MEADQLKQLAALAEKYPELRDLLASVASPAQNELMKRASVGRAFTKSLYKQVLCEGIENPLDFDEFTALGDVERVAYTDGQFGIRDSARLAYLRQWSDKAELAKWSQRVAEFYAAETTSDRDRALKVLQLKIVYDPMEALAQLRRLYLEADSRFDLTRCFALLGVLSSQRDHLDDALFDAWQDYTALYGARALFTQEYHQTACYFRRSDMERDFRNLLRSKGGKWIFHVHGDGGMAKPCCCDG